MIKINKGITKEPHKLLIYGPVGTGKTTFAASMPNALILDMEDRVSHIDCDSTKIKSNSELAQAIEFLIKEKHSYQTCVFDTFDSMLSFMSATIAKENGKATVAEIPYGKGYNLVAAKLIELLRLTERLRAKGINIAFVAHSKIRKFDDPVSEAYDRYSLDCHEKMASPIMQYVDTALFANLDMMVVDGKAKATGNRVVYTSPAPSHEAKNSFSLPAKLPLKWSAVSDSIDAFHKGGKK